jgi:hypothetical protein
MKFIYSIILYFVGMAVYGQGLQQLVFSGGKNFTGKDVLQLEYGLNIERLNNNINQYNQQISQYGLIKYGVLHNLDIAFSYNFSRQQLFVSDQMRRSNGLSNFTAGFKKKISQNFSLKSDLGFSRNEFDKLVGAAQITAISEHNIDSYLALENNLGLSWSSGSPSANLVYLSGITFTIPYPLDIIVEYYGQYGRESWDNYANLGIGYYFSADIMIEAYAGFGNTNDQDTTFVSLNLYWRLVPARYNK